MSGENNRVLNFTAEEHAYMALGYYENGNLRRAMENVDDAIYLFDEDPPLYKDKVELAACYQMRANVLAKWGEQKKSLKTFKQAEKIRIRQNDRIGYADCLIDEGTARDEFGNARKALKLRKKAVRELKKKKGTEKKLAKAYYFMGATYYKKGNIARADKCFCEALRSGERPEYLVFALGCVKLEEKAYHEAVLYFLESAAAREKMYCDMPYHLRLCEIYTLIGDVYTLMDLHVKAVKFYVRAMKISEACYRYLPHGGLGQLYARLSNTYEKLSEPDRAAFYRDMSEAV